MGTTVVSASRTRDGGFQDSRYSRAERLWSCCEGCEGRLISQIRDNSPDSITKTRSGILHRRAVWIGVLKRASELGETGAIVLLTHEGTEVQSGA